MYSHEQVPIALCPSHLKTIENKGIEEVNDCANNTTDKDAYQFCTLNLAVPMKLRPDKLNLTKAHLVFQASGFREGKDWGDKDAELSQWDPSRVIVSFQENAWVDARTHIYGLEQMFKPVNNIEGTLLKGVIFEDNLSSHQTNTVSACFRDHLPNFIHPFFFQLK